MHAESRYAAAAAPARQLIDAFLERTRRYQRLTAAAAHRLDLPTLAVRDSEDADALASRALAVLGDGAPGTGSAD
jgi:hypothetical protein